MRAATIQGDSPNNRGLCVHSELDCQVIVKKMKRSLQGSILALPTSYLTKIMQSNGKWHYNGRGLQTLSKRDSILPLKITTTQGRRKIN